MAFKKMKQVEETIYANRLRLEDDGDSVTGVFLYKDYDDVLVADAHYVKTKHYSGYVHCCEDCCPACKKGIRIQSKLFIPFLVIAEFSEGYNEDTVVFWDRNKPFAYQLRKEVFDKYPNPANIMFKITRHGKRGDVNTTYSIIPVRNFISDIDDVLNSIDVHFPEYYEAIIKDVDVATLSDWLNEGSSDSSDSYVPSANYSYQVKPRKRIADPEDLDMEEGIPGDPVEFSDTEEDSDNVSGLELPAYVHSTGKNSAVVEGKDSLESDDDDDGCEPTF